jgi:hypothetical protein
MPRENHVAKQQRIGERLSRAMARAHVDRRELAVLTGYSEAQIVLWERGLKPLYPTRVDKAVSRAGRQRRLHPASRLLHRAIAADRSSPARSPLR